MGLRFLVSTVRRGDPLEGSGDLVEIDLDRELMRVLARVPLPIYSTVDVDKVFGGKRGFRGIRVHAGRILVATFDSVLILDFDGVLLGRITHRLFSDIHGIEVDEYGVLVTITGLDAVARVAFDSRLIRFRPLRALAQGCALIDGSYGGPAAIDHRRSVRTDMQIHPNYICVAERSLWICCRALGTVVRTDLSFSEPYCVLPRGSLAMPHDARITLEPEKLRIDVTETGKSCVSRIELDRRGAFRVSSQSTCFAGGMNPNLGPSRGRRDWARGLVKLAGGVTIFGQSPGRVGMLLPSGRARLWQIDAHPSSSIFEVLPLNDAWNRASRAEWRPLRRVPQVGVWPGAGVAHATQ